MKTKMRILQGVTNVLYTDEDCPSTRQARQFPSLPGDECSASAELFFPRFYVLVCPGRFCFVSMGHCYMGDCCDSVCDNNDEGTVNGSAWRFIECRFQMAQGGALRCHGCCVCAVFTDHYCC